MNERHRELHALLASLGHASRFRIALRLLERKRSVGELALAIGLSQSCTTRHVQALERAGIVRSRRDGKRVMVGIDLGQADLAGLLEWLGAGAGEPDAAAARRAARQPHRRTEPAAVGGRRERAKRRSARGTRPAPTPRAVPAPRTAQEDAPAGPVASGTPPTPAATGDRQPRRSRDSIEDFLL